MQLTKKLRGDTTALFATNMMCARMLPCYEQSIIMKKGGALVHQLPHMCGEPGATLVSVLAIALVLADSVPHGAVGQPSLGFLLAAVEVGDLGTVDHSLCHAVAWQWAHVAASVAVAPSTELHMVSSAHLCVG